MFWVLQVRSYLKSLSSTISSTTTIVSSVDDAN